MIDAQVFLIILLAIAAGHWVGVRARAYVERRKHMQTNEAAFVAASNALIKRQLDQLDLAEAHGCEMAPIKARMLAEDRALMQEFSRLPK